MIENKALDKLRETSASDNMYIVGGAVRDYLLGLPCDDIDIVVTMSFAELTRVLEPLATRMTTEAVGGVNAVIKAVIEGTELDFALARSEVSTGGAHKDFSISTNATLKDDLGRRDLTINAIAMKLNGDLIDPFNGVRDLNERIARPVTVAFSEDPLRVLRAGRFIARFDLKGTQELFSVCRTLTPDGLPKERLGKEIVKVFKQAPRPRIFFEFLEQVGWLELIAPELQALRRVPQDPKHHPEGDALTHTLATIDAAPQGDVRARLTMMLHDLGKLTTTVKNKHGRWSAPGHEEASLHLGALLLQRLGMLSEVGGKMIRQIALLVELHMLHSQGNISDRKLKQRVRRLHDAGLTFEDLAIVCTADKSGRPPLPAGEPESITDMRRRVASFTESNDFDLIVTGRDLIAVGLEPGPSFKVILDRARDLQDAGVLSKDNWREVLGV